MKCNNTLFLTTSVIGQIHADIKLNRDVVIRNHFYSTLQYGTNLHTVLPMK